MNQDLNKPQAISDQLADLKAMAEKANIMTPEIERYLREGNERFQAKIMAKQPITKADVAFMDEVRQWMEMPRRWRNEHPTLELELLREEWSKITPKMAMEAKKRDISPWQWLDLSLLANINKRGDLISWIDKEFQFPGGGKILAGDIHVQFNKELTSLPENLIVEGVCNLSSCTALIALPEGFRVEGELSAQGCTSLATVPNNLRVKRGASFNGCTKLTEIPQGAQFGGSLSLHSCTNLTSIPESLNVWGDLDLSECENLKKIPNGLSVGGTMSLIFCVGLTRLPEDLFVKGDLLLDHDLHPQVKIDAERLKKEGKVLGKIKIF